MKFETLGEYCKWLEKNFSPEQAIPTLPVIIRLDGNNFHNWTKGLARPFDEKLVQLMADTTKFLVGETNAVIGYTQSDEITLILHSSDRNIELYHEGKKQKILSKLTAKCVNYFNTRRAELLPDHNKLAVFDARMYQVPSLHDACNQLLWRENDAIKNSIQMLAQSLFSHNSLQKLNSDELQFKMFTEKNVNWNELPANLKRGTYVRCQRVSKPFTQEEVAELPEQHNARKNPDLIVERVVIETVELPVFKTIGNQIDVVFNGATAILKEEFNSEAVAEVKKVLSLIDVKYLGIPNLCFSLTNKEDKREVDFLQQRLERGFDDSETWSLRDTIARFILPRLKRYEEIANDFLVRDEQLVSDISAFIQSLELVTRNNGSCILTDEEKKQMFDGFEKFHKIIMSLWW